MTELLQASAREREAWREIASRDESALIAEIAANEQAIRDQWIGLRHENQRPSVQAKTDQLTERNRELVVQINAIRSARLSLYQSQSVEERNAQNSRECELAAEISWCQAQLQGFRERTLRMGLSPRQVEEKVASLQERIEELREQLTLIGRTACAV